VWEAGLGPPLVLFHGWGLSGRPYRPVVSALAARGYRALAPSLAVMERPWSLDGLAGLAASVVTGTEAAPAAVVGHSFGGAVALRMTCDFPELVSSLVLVNTLGVSPGRRALVRAAFPGPHWRIGAQGATAAALLGSAIRQGGWGSLSGAARWVLSASLEEEMEVLRSRRVPTAVLWAPGDTLLPRWIGERAAELLGASFEPIEAGGGWPGPRGPDHDWPLRGPEFFAERVHTTLSTLGRRSPRRAG